MRGRGIVLGVVVGALLAGAACSSSSKSSTPGATSGSTTPGVTTHTTGAGPGVSAKEIKLGIVLVDFKCIPTQFVDEERPDQQKAYQAFIDDINQNGGINGRTITPVYKTICPLTNTDALSACTAFADDDNVFAVIGVFGDLSGDADLCMTKTKQRILLTYDLTQELVDKAPPGRLLTPDILKDRKLRVVMSLLASNHILDGKKVAVLGESDANDRISNVIEPALKKMGVDRASTGIVTLTGSDTTAAQSQLDGFIERWRTENIDALILAGDGVEGRPFVEKVRKAFPNIQLVSDSTGVLDGGQAEVKANYTPNAFAGVITAEGRTGVEHTQTQHFKDCKKIFETQTGITVPSPNAVIKLPDGRKNNIYGEEEDACVFVKMFETIAKKVGPDLNNANWSTTVDNFGPISIYSTDFASLHAGKYDADDTFRLVAFDPTIGDAGDWKQVTAIQNVSGS